MKKYILNLILLILVAGGIVLFGFQTSRGLSMQKLLNRSESDKAALEAYQSSVKEEIFSIRKESAAQEQEQTNIQSSMDTLEEDASRLTEEIAELESEEESLTAEIEGYENAWQEAKERAQR